jgi:FSR family fosmidomycin resistance protein-like MFS transporter
MSSSKETAHLPTSTEIEDIALAEPLENGEFQTDRVLTIVGAHAVHDTYTAFLPPLLPVFIQSLALSRTEGGLLSVFISTPSIFQPVIGHVADRFSLKALVILAPALTGVMMSLLGFTPSYWVMAFFLIIVGLSSAGFHATAPVMISALSGRSLGRGMGLWMVGGEIGRALGPIVIVIALKFLDLKGISWLVPGGVLASTIVYLRLKDVPSRRPDSTEEMAWGSVFQSLRPIMIPLLGLLVTRAFLLPALSIYLPTYLTDEGAELWFAGISLSILEMAGILGAFMGGTISDRIGRRKILAISMTTAPILTFLFVASDGWGKVVLLPFLGLATLSTAPVMMAVVLESVPENRALANGIYLALSFLSRSGAILVVGAMGDLFGLGLAFQISAIIMLISLPIIPFLPKRNASI